ncbi:MAG TPA: hypothetical protein VFE52_02590 [Devosia sp.]|jgi:hypothetical protein|nr:hypothetical protein [Devosia sp.]
MTRYFFHIVTPSGEQLDHVGMDLIDTDAARAEAMISAQKLVGARTFSGKPADGVEIRIVTADGDHVCVVHYQCEFIIR